MTLDLSPTDAFNLELVKLLLQVAAADGVVQRRERDVILGLARSWSLPEPLLKTLLVPLDANLPTPEPDLSVLKQRPDDVLEAAQAVSVVDGAVQAEESVLLRRVKAALGL